MNRSEAWLYFEDAATGPSFVTDALGKQMANCQSFTAFLRWGSWRHLVISFFLLPHSVILYFNMKSAAIFQGARNIVVSGGTVNAANTVRESLGILAYNTAECLVQINYNVINATTPDTVIPLRPNSSTRFTGRTDIIAKLKEHFASPSDGLRTRKYFLLHGMGGIGKTQICLRFIEEMSDQ